jgi:hypothetical protein
MVALHNSYPLVFFDASRVKACHKGLVRNKTVIPPIFDGVLQ